MNPRSIAFDVITPSAVVLGAVFYSQALLFSPVLSTMMLTNAYAASIGV